MTKIAVIKTGGKQYKVKGKDQLKIEKVPGKQGDKIEFNEVLLVADENGKDAKVGAPLVDKAKVEGKILEQGRSDKVTVIKYKAKTRYMRKRGHRQPFTKVEIAKI